MFAYLGKGGFCWIKNGTALLIAVGVPVALVILFNFIALTWTVIAIYKVRKVKYSLIWAIIVASCRVRN